MDATTPAFKNNQFDLIIASDILEHLQNDSLAIKQWYRILKPNGRMIIMVPAFNFLWSSHDLANHHFRRYTKDQLQAVLHQAGLKIERLSYASISTFFPAVIIRFIQRLQPPKTNNFQLRSSHSGFNDILTKIVNFENSVLKYINYPFGVSVFAIVKK